MYQRIDCKEKLSEIEIVNALCQREYQDGKKEKRIAKPWK